MPAKGYVKENGRNIVVRMRLTEEEKRKLDLLCDKIGVNYSDFLRKQIELRYDYFKPLLNSTSAE